MPGPGSLEHLGEVAVVRSAGEESGRLADELFEVAQTLEFGLAGAMVQASSGSATFEGIADELQASASP